MSFKSPQTPLYERGAFYELLLILYWEYFKEELRTESVSSPLFRKEGAGGDLTIPIYRKLIFLTPLYKRGFFMTLVLMILLGIYLIELRTESIYLPLKYPLFRKEGGRGRFN